MEPGSKIPEEFDRSILQQEDIILYEAYRGVFEMMACGAMIFSEDGILLKANKKALELFGVNGRQAVESSILNYSDYLFFDMDGYRLPVKKWPVNRLLNHEFLKDDKYIIKNINKSKYSFVSITGIPQFDSNGQFKSGILILHDISDQVETDNRLEEEIEKTLKKSNELKEYQEILKTERQLLQSIIDNIPVMISIYDEALGSITLNNALTEITGWTQRDIANRNVMELVYPDPMYRAKVAGFMKSLKKGFKDFTMRTKEGRDIETSWANVRLADGRMAGVGVDISGRKRLEKELILAREKAERENRVQSAFIQNISHEVRTPMNSILGFTELLHKEITTASGREFLSA
ncbi:MAG: PAS domain S-box protein, partial [Bacteroidales bacterium]